MSRALKFLYLVHFLNVLADFILIPIFALFVTSVNISVQYVGVLFALGYVTASITSLFLVKVREGKHVDEYLLRLCYFLKALGWFLLIFVQTLPMLIFVQIIKGIGYGLGAPSFAALFSDHLNKNKRLAEWGDLVVIENVAICIGSIFAGFVMVKFGFTAIFITMAILEFFAFFLFHYGLQNRNHR